MCFVARFISLIFTLLFIGIFSSPSSASLEAFFAYFFHISLPLLSCSFAFLRRSGSLSRCSSLTWFLGQKLKKRWFPNATLPRDFPSRKIAQTLPSPDAVLPLHLHLDSLYGRRGVRRTDVRDVITNISCMNRCPNKS